MHFSNTYTQTNVTVEMANLIRQMPKLEIHVHLEGSIDPRTTYHMAQRNNIALPVATLEEWESYYEFRDFIHFIDVYLRVRVALKPNNLYT